MFAILPNRRGGGVTVQEGLKNSRIFYAHLCQFSGKSETSISKRLPEFQECTFNWNVNLPFFLEANGKKRIS
jgi:hypothetical protein